jgi:hypothetical protein
VRACAAVVVVVVARQAVFLALLIPHLLLQPQ